MALKIEFAAEFKDAERIQKILNDLNDQMSKLAQTGAAVGQASASGFQSLTSSLKGFDDATKGLRSIKELSESIHSLSKLQGEVGIIDKMFADIGRSISRGIGDEKADAIKRVREEIAKLQQESEKAKVLVQEAEYNYRIAQARGDEPAMKHFEAQRRGASIYGAKVDREARLAEDELEDAESFGGMMRDTFGRGSRYGKMISRVGRMGGYLGAAIGGVRLADEIFNVAPQKEFAAKQQYEVSAASEAISGDITRNIMRELNIGSSASGRFEAGNNVLSQAATVGSAVMNYVGGVISSVLNFASGGLLNIGGGYKTMQESYFDVLSGREAIDKKVYGLATGRVGQYELRRMQMFNEIDRFFGPGGSAFTRNALGELHDAGITMDMANQMAQMLLRAGVGITGGDANLVRAQQRLGLGDTFMQQVARQRFMRGGSAAEDMIFSSIAGAGLTGYDQGRARSVLGEALGQIAAQTSGYNLDVVAPGMIGMVRAAQAETMGPNVAGRGFLTSEEATRGAIQVFQSGTGMMGAGGVYDAVATAGLARIGITNPLDAQYINALIRKNRPDLAAKAIATATGKTENEAAKMLESIGSDVEAFQKNFENPLLSTSKLDRGKIRGMLIGGEEKVGVAEFEAAAGKGGELAAQFKIGGIAVSPEELKQAREVMGDITPKEQLDRARASEERAVQQAAASIERTLGHAVVSEIAKGFTQMAEAVKRSAQKLEEDTRESRERTREQGAAGRNVAGPGRSYDQVITVFGPMYTSKKLTL